MNAASLAPRRVSGLPTPSSAGTGVAEYGTGGLVLGGLLGLGIGAAMGHTGMGAGIGAAVGAIGLGIWGYSKGKAAAASGG